MAKYFGEIGYSNTIETKPGVWEDDITPRKYYGDVLKSSTKWVNGISIEDNLTVSTRISILADAYAFEHFSKIKYCEYMGIKWKVVDVEPRRPRLILTLGGEYNGEKATTSY